MNNDIDHILMQRRDVEIPPGLAQRIINMAQPRAKRRERWKDIWADIQAMLVVPRPAYALAMAALIGLYIGVDMSEVQATTDFTSLFSVASADFDEGNWL